MPRALANLVQEGDQVRLRMSMPDLDEIARMLIALGCPLTVINPPELRASFRRVAHEAVQAAESC